MGSFVNINVSKAFWRLGKKVLLQCYYNSFQKWRCHSTHLYLAMWHLLMGTVGLIFSNRVEFDLTLTPVCWAPPHSPVCRNGITFFFAAGIDITFCPWRKNMRLGARKSYTITIWFILFHLLLCPLIYHYLQNKS